LSWGSDKDEPLVTPAEFRYLRRNGRMATSAATGEIDPKRPSSFPNALTRLILEAQKKVVPKPATSRDSKAANSCKSDTSASFLEAHDVRKSADAALVAHSPFALDHRGREPSNRPDDDNTGRDSDG
jgi:hypothetical protein